MNSQRLFQLRVLSTLGYDSEILPSLSPRDRASMAIQGTLWLAACGLLALAAAVAGWTAFPSYWTPLAAGLFVLLLTVNLLRVAVAGGGVAEDGVAEGGVAGAGVFSEHGLDDTLARCASWRPQGTATGVFLVLGLILSQPAQLWLAQDTLDPQVEHYRDGLLSRHDRAAAALGVDGKQIRRAIEGGGFPLQRLKLLWQDPQRTGMWSLVFCFAMLIPGLWARWIAIDALRSYERSRARQKHQARSKLGRAAEAERARCLAAFQSAGQRIVGQR